MIAFEVTINDDKPIVVGGNNVTTAILSYGYSGNSSLSFELTTKK